MHESLKVYLKDSFVGWLSHETVGDEYSFEYDKAYLASPVEGALSFALPLTGEKFDSPHTFNFFSNLLPPRVVRQRLGSSLHLSQHNVFGFLKAIGGECAGAVSVYPPWVKPTPQDVEHTRVLSEEEAVRTWRRRSGRNTAARMVRRWGLPLNGEQDVLQQRQWFVGRVVLQDGQHNLLQQRERFGGGIGHSDRVVGAIPGQGCANIYPYKVTF